MHSRQLNALALLGVVRHLIGGLCPFTLWWAPVRHSSVGSLSAAGGLVFVVVLRARGFADDLVRCVLLLKPLPGAPFEGGTL